MNRVLSETQKRILELKRERNALILAHNYQALDIQDIADFIGDSLQLARKSAEGNGYDMIIFAGVKFMAEMASILAGDIPVYIPAPKALCPLAAYVSADKIQEMKEVYPGAPVIVYVNTTAEAKTAADYICTSGTAVEVVEATGADTVLFGPDANLAEYVRRKTGVKVIDIDTRGHCYVHRQFDVAQLALLKEEYHSAITIVHPECDPDVQDAADMVGSTGMMARTVATSPHSTFIIATELGLIEQLQVAHPDKTVIPAYERAVCIQMKKNTLEGVLGILENLPQENLVTVPEEYHEHIRAILQKMSKVLDQGAAKKATAHS